MIRLNAFAISGILITVLYLPLSIFIISKGKTKLSRIYSLHILSVSIWGIGSFLIGSTSNPDLAMLYLKLAYSGVIFIPIFFLHSVLILTKKTFSIILTFSYLQGIYFLGATWSDSVFCGIRLAFDSFYYSQGFTNYLISFIIWVSLVILAHIVLLKHFKSCYPEQKREIFYVLLSMPFGFGGGVMNFLPGFNINIYPYGNFLIPVYSFIITYAILKHQILDIVVAIKKSIVYSILIASISIIYLIVIILAERLLQEVLGYNSLSVSIFSAFAMGIIFVPLKNKIQLFVDKYFFKGTQVQIAEENERLRQEVARTEKLKAVSTLASGIAHEVKNPLTALKTFTEYLPEKKNDPEFLNKFSKIVGTEVDRIDGLVHQLLDFAKPSPLVKESADIHKLVDDTLQLLNSKFVKHKIKIVKDYTDSKLITQIDHNRFKQALLNLLLNAIEAMENGGVLTIQTTLHNSLFTLHVKDTGCGIEKKDLLHVFDPFYSKKDKGTGLGLSIVHQIIQEHGGKISVESKVGSGTTFTIELPIKNS